jgi:hypothetical protein
MMEYLSETAAIFPAQILRQCFRERVAYRIRMAEALALDNFDGVSGRVERRNIKRLHAFLLGGSDKMPIPEQRS